MIPIKYFSYFMIMTWRTWLKVFEVYWRIIFNCSQVLFEDDVSISSPFNCNCNSFNSHWKACLLIKCVKKDNFSTPIYGCKSPRVQCRQKHVWKKCFSSRRTSVLSTQGGGIILAKGLFVAYSCNWSCHREGLRERS